jgi:archaellum component FlaC
MRAAVELRVHNTPQGGSVKAVFQPAQGIWHRARQAWSGVADGAAPRPVTVHGSGGWALAFTQILLAVTLAGLLTDRVTGWMTPAKPPLHVTPTEAPWAAPLAEVTKLEQQLLDLSRMQGKVVETIQTQQQGMAQIQRTMAKVSSTQETVASGILTVKQEMEQRRKGSGREADRMTRVLMSKALSEQEQLEAEIHSLVIANERLARERTQLEQHNQELNKRLKTVGRDVSKAVVPEREKLIVAQQSAPSQPSPIAEAKAVPPQASFLFWVTFSDGTSEDSIDQWVRDMHGRKGALSEGWQAVEILPPTEPMERFLDQLKQAKIVKAVKVSR